MDEARVIYQAFLDHTSQAAWDRDFETVADAMAYPHYIGTRGREVTVPDRASLITLARDFRDNLHTLGATAYYRICRGATFGGDAQDQINGLHETFVLRGATMLLTPFTGTMTLILRNGTWHGAGIRSDVRNADLRINAAPLPHTGACAPNEHSGPAGPKTEDKT
ncbi:hypothetical protein JANAI62_27330 [Jannaschia pagri]|uniref:SnoaL-like domain-containing protein n=1 Tax=Jannaschia pagri TaxID=2829797 RepID=A0ABQ4NNX0_9RHOB|nr:MULTISPECIES: hypothetical protein [unclassified Jannaschia]GIT92276.1 hypothetical protein JANAI61_27340 [Jannaschia sp. AI_61]GIT96110.1 hypothetical protein JANAI62_27330 [Jannaschia sp. AI_62]